MKLILENPEAPILRFQELDIGEYFTPKPDGANYDLVFVKIPKVRMDFKDRPHVSPQSRVVGEANCLALFYMTDLEQNGACFYHYATPESPVLRICVSEVRCHIERGNQ